MKNTLLIEAVDKLQEKFSDLRKQIIKAKDSATRVSKDLGELSKSLDQSNKLETSQEIKPHYQSHLD